jgi:dienelactone hydrolase
MKVSALTLGLLFFLLEGCAGPAGQGKTPADAPSTPVAHDPARGKQDKVATGSPSPTAEPASPARADLAKTSDGIVKPGIRLRTYQTRFKQTIWVYTGDPPPPHPGLILIAPAGGSLLLAASLGSGDTVEHLPYVSAGYTVVSYSLSGEKPDDLQDPEKVERAMLAFIRSLGGAVDGLAALQFALEQFPELDSSRLIVAGHSSAGTLALQLAASDPRIKGVIAYAPEPEPSARLTEKELATLTEAIPTFPQFVRITSPLWRVADIKVPVFLFHSKADENVPTERISRFVKALRQHNSALTLEQVKRGDHYGSMIDPGIARALAWLAKNYPASAAPPPAP